MAYTLIITEKPNAAKKIAEALADGKAIKKGEKGVSYYEVTHGKEDIVVCSAVGHLFTVTENEKKGWTYPIFDVKWEQSSKVNKASKFTSKYVTAIKKLVKGANKFVVATDYDIEGEVIGYNVIRFICNQKDAMRMKFSTLTKDELRESYKNKSKTVDWGQVNAGVTRHELDWYYGINLSRALSLAMRSAGQFKVLSIGRVQGPALKTVVERELEIKAFKPEPYWEIEMSWNKDKKDKTVYIASHKDGKIFDKEKAKKIHDKVKSEKDAKIESIETKKFSQQPPNPFNLTSLQTESYRCFKIQPKRTLDIAQELYTAGYISYPRTSSQELPPSIGYKKIMDLLLKNNSYTKLVQELLKGNLKPNNGKKKDPAHPAIYPTGLVGNIKDEQRKIYDIIVKRFMATFAEPAERETLIINFDVKKELFISRGTTTIKKGWHEYYAPYVKLDEVELPLMKKGDMVVVKSMSLLDKQTKPPKRYTPSSIIKELEKRNLGTKATRATVIETLFDRGYVVNTPMEATDLGIKTVAILDDHSPIIVDEKLTSEFEDEMEEIREHKKKPEQILDHAKDVLTKTLKDFKKDEKKIGERLIEATRESEEKQNHVGKCMKCETGNLSIRRGKFGKFIACDNYPDCKTTFTIPKNGLVKVSEELCPECKYPEIIVIKKGKRPQQLCINPDCPTKKVDIKTDKEGHIGRDCPKCKSPLVLRKSSYGAFIACSGYPKCRYTESVEHEDHKNDKNIKK